MSSKKQPQWGFHCLYATFPIVAYKAIINIILIASIAHYAETAGQQGEAQNSALVVTVMPKRTS